MAEVHDLVLRYGRDAAKDLVPREDRHLVDIAAQMLADESQHFNITYSGFCLVGMPHKRLEDDEVWERSNGRVTLTVTPGYLPFRGKTKKYGVPFGSRARLILFYLQSEAIRRRSREVPLGRNMADWLTRMDISLGGKSYIDVREQAARISACNLIFSWDAAGGDGFQKEGLVQGGIRLHDIGSTQGSLWDETVTLSETFWRALQERPVPISETALRLIGGKSSMAIDCLVWLSYRLHSLTRPTPVSWPSLHNQFGSGCANLRHFKPNFLKALKLATAAYPQARFDVTADGLTLHPSPAPVLRLETSR